MLPRADSSRLFFLDCSDQLVAAAEQFPCILAETPLLSDGGLGAKRFRKSREIGYELVVVDERAFQRWGARRRSVVDIDVEAGDAGVIAGVCHGRDYNASQRPQRGADGMVPTQRLSEGAAIQAVWAWFLRNRNRDIPFVEIVARVRALAPGADVERIKSGFERRLRRARR